VRLPPNLGEILLARLASMPDEVQGMLRYMAVIGERASVGLLAALTATTASVIGSWLRVACDAHVVRPDDADTYASATRWCGRRCTPTCCRTSANRCTRRWLD
jgi:hypothetical protein